MSIQGSRAVPRVVARFRVDYSHEGNYLISCSRDISADGMFVSTEAPAPVGTVLQLVFTVGVLHEVAVAAQVVWVGTPGDASEPGMGLRFLDPPPPLREALLELVHRIAILDQEVAPAACPVEPSATRSRPLGFAPRRKGRLLS
ncbi:MAG: PilZ domain-containing protein [Deltaproteobacteria bacterium]|nr:PilZ domain-containing protein [Deltaproteobacteria bacterium]